MSNEPAGRTIKAATASRDAAKVLGSGRAPHKPFAVPHRLSSSAVGNDVRADLTAGATTVATFLRQLWLRMLDEAVASTLPVREIISGYYCQVGTSWDGGSTLAHR